MKSLSLSLFIGMLMVNQSSLIASPFKLSQVNIPVPTPGEEITPAPESEITPAPEPELEATPESEITPAPEPELEAAPESEITPAPEPELEPLPGPSDIQPEPEAPPVPEVPPAGDSSSDLYFLSRAKNLARQAAIQENGGLMQYRPEASMYGPALQSPFRRNPDGSVTFTFQGGVPGAPQLDKETEVLVDGNIGVTVVYNGPVRGDSQVVDSSEENKAALAALDEDSFIARARNLARQAGIAANGGLDAYRPEASMFGPTSSAPFVKNEDGSVTFTFKGGAPLSETPTQETAVTVTKEGMVTVDFNRPIQN